MDKPLFRWIVPPDECQREAKDLLAHCASIQKLFLDLKERRLKREDATELFEAVTEVMVENGIELVGPQWFADLFKRRPARAA